MTSFLPTLGIIQYNFKFVYTFLKKYDKIIIVCGVILWRRKTHYLKIQYINQF